MCSAKIQWNKDMILMCYYLYTYYSGINNITCPFKVDLEPCYLADNQFQASEAHDHGNCDVVTIMLCGDEGSYHYILLTIQHKSKTCTVYDSKVAGNKRLDREFQINLFQYLKRKNLWMNQVNWHR